MYNQRGGLKLRRQGMTHLDALIKMLNSPGVVISILSVNSLKGFILIFRVEEEYAEYLMQNADGRFTIPSTTYILKLAVINPDEVTLEPYALSTKISESPDSFYNEVLLQQHIWIKSITGNRPPICPSIGSFLLFDNINAKKCLKFFKNLSDNELKSYQNGTTNGNVITSLGKAISLRDMAYNKIDLFKYLLRQMNIQNTGIGMILMQNVPDCETLETFLSKNIIGGPAIYNYSVVGNARAKFNASMSLLISQIVRLFIEIGVIHFDLHTNNALYGENKKWLLIDFGLASNILIDTDDFYLDTGEKEIIKSKKEDYNDEFDSLISRKGKRTLTQDNREKERQFIANVMDYLNQIDRDKLKEKYSVIPAQEKAKRAAERAAANPANPILQQKAIDAATEAADAEAEPAIDYQMMWYEDLKTLPDIDSILENAFKQLDENMSVKIDNVGLLGNTLNTYQTQGILFGSEGQTATDYEVPFPDMPCNSTSSLGCTIMGGNKTKKMYRKRKNKKNKNYNKTIKCMNNKKKNKKKKYQNVSL